jgi:NAD(P)-dependent dehydrogenase (short-subunit alcohol dehydrogenase family)
MPNQDAKVIQEFGKLDATVNNAGIAGADKPTHELSEKE